MNSLRCFTVWLVMQLACASLMNAQNAPSSYIVADPVADLVIEGQVVGRAVMGQVVSIRALAENGSWGLVTVGGVEGWISSKNLVPARPLSIAYFQGTHRFSLGQQEWNQGNKSAAQKHFTAAIPLLRRAVDLAKKENNQRYLASASTNLAISYADTDQFAAAEPHYLQAYRINESLLGQGHERLGIDARNLAFFYKRWKHPKDALAWHQQALGIFAAKYGDNHAETAKERLETGSLLFLEMGQLQEAETLLSQAFPALQTALGAGDPQTLRAGQELGQVYTALGKIREAEAVFRLVLAAREATVGPNHISVAGTCQFLAGVCETLGKVDEVEGLLRRSLNIRERELGAEHPNLIVSLRDLADLASAAGRFTEAEQYLDRAMRIAAKISKNSAEVANVQEGYGNLRKLQGRYDQSEEMYRSSLATLEKAGHADADIAHTLRGLALLLTLTERRDEALPVLERRLRLLEGIHGKNALQLADTIEDLATIHRLKDRLDQAEQMERRALDIVRRYPGSAAYEAATWNNLGAVYSRQNKHDKAQDAYRRSLALFEQNLESKNHRTAYVRINLALEEQTFGNRAAAQKLARDARMVLDQCPGNHDQALSVALSIEADSARAEGRMDEALEAANTLRRLTRTRMNQMLLVRSERERLQFLHGEYAVWFHQHLSWVLDAGQNQRVLDATAAWVLNGKNLANELEANVAKLSRHAASSRVEFVLSELEKVRRFMAEITWHEAATTGAARVVAEMTRLAAEEDRLTREIRAMGTPENVGGAWIELDAIRNLVPARSRLIEMMRLRKPDGTQRYVAWIIPPAGHGNVAVADLGDAAEIEKAVASLNHEIGQSVEHILNDGEAPAEKRLRDAAGAVARLVFEPLRQHFQDVERCLIAPDAALWLVPWAVLPVEADAYLVEKFEICQMASGRELARPVARTAGKAPLIIADPDFDMPQKNIRRPAEASSDKSRAKNSPSKTTRSFTGLSIAKVERLPGTADEARAVAPALAAYAGTDATLLMGDKALESAFKSASRPSVLMLSTHGFFFPADQDDAQAFTPSLNNAQAISNTGAALDNPLLRCGLLLAGCNTRTKASSSTSQPDDGILSGLEVLGVDLEGCKLVVLSACETGLGKAVAGEGLAGLRQAFQLAGAGGVMDALWSVPDDETVQLMAHFFQRLAQSQPPSAALRDAQRHIISTRREQGGSAHPFFWGAFGFTGR